LNSFTLAGPERFEAEKLLGGGRDVDRFPVTGRHIGDEGLDADGGGMMSLNRLQFDGRLPAGLSGVGEESIGNRSERENLIDSASFDCFFRHAKDDATLLVLSDGSYTDFFHSEHSLDSVGTHSSQEGSSGIGAGCIRNRVEQYVYGRALIADKGTVFDVHTVAGSGSTQKHMEIPRCDEGQPGLETITVLCLPNANGAEIVEAICERAGEDGWDVLSDYDAWAILGEPGEDGPNRFGAAGGCTDRDYCRR